MNRLISACLLFTTLALAPAASGASPEDNRSIVEEFTRVVYNEQQLDRIPDYVGESFVDSSPGAPDDAKGPGFVLRQAKQSFVTFPDLTFEIQHTIAERDLVTMHWRATGTAASTGNPTIVEGISIFRMDEGKIVESWDIVDRLGMLQQLGFKITPPQE